MDTNIDIFNAVVIEREDLHEELAVIKIQPTDGQVSEFLAGQFCTLGLPPADGSAMTKPDGTPRSRPKLIRRAYSIASSPLVREYLEIFVVLVAEGKLTPNLWTVAAGGKLFLDPRIRGEFSLENIRKGKDMVCVSTGTGIAPFMSMLRTYRGTGRWRRFVMIHGVRQERDLGYREELERIAAEDDSLIYIPVCSREPDDSPWQGERGRVNALLEDAKFEKLTGFRMAPDESDLFLCGNPAMITDAEQMFVKRGFVTSTKTAVGNIQFERYW
jgi:ferredoxin--NADP+ reductase